VGGWGGGGWGGGGLGWWGWRLGWVMGVGVGERKWVSTVVLVKGCKGRGQGGKQIPRPARRWARPAAFLHSSSALAPTRRATRAVGAPAGPQRVNPLRPRPHLVEPKQVVDKGGVAGVRVGGAAQLVLPAATVEQVQAELRGLVCGWVGWLVWFGLVWFVGLLVCLLVGLFVGWLVGLVGRLVDTRGLHVNAQLRRSASISFPLNTGK